MVYVSAYLSFILEYLKQFKLCPKRPALPRPIKVQVLFELFGALYMYISELVQDTEIQTCFKSWKDSVYSHVMSQSFSRTCLEGGKR